MAECIYEPGGRFIPPKDPTTSGLPAGGTTGQYLVKASDEDGDVTWASGGGGGSPVIVDTALSTTSTNPVQNRAIGRAITDINTSLAEKASQADLNQLEQDTTADIATLTAGLALKADTADLDDYYTKTAANALLDGKVDKVVGKGLSTNDYTAADKTKLSGLADIRLIGSGLSLNATTGELTATGGGGSDGKVFVAEYGVTTAQEIIDYMATANEPYAPILVKRANSYYTAVISSPGTDRVNLSTFGTISGEGYLFSYTVTNGNWSASNIGFQTKLVSGTSIKTINGESLLGSGDIAIGGGGITVDDALSETSLNPVQNRVIYGALESMRLAMTGYLERLAALEAKLANFEETRLQITDGTNTVDKTVLTKPYVAPTP